MYTRSQSEGISVLLSILLLSMQSEKQSPGLIVHVANFRPLLLFLLVVFFHISFYMNISRDSSNTHIVSACNRNDSFANLMAIKFMFMSMFTWSKSEGMSSEAG